ncbi:MarR family winged helix-turn-helix transcriptional regulator [Amycolatopsis jiangsuensis]|uniref:DNA-binding MarR family transcriptional regulator n=1 Tax=Amycolatopsis jiangsuensis TaxID=1181879 RepID=A0A840J1U7_9PSEU|nr:MarR family winged helix-turn-helix transcriptional regulator [Amycolatopsis jiangsuensis]MBB4687883.1 DNA-binding MarR family transcriptional regulator [Amycolatopsis jiangsuensis]
MADRTPRAHQFTELVNELFVANGALLVAGDALAGPVGLTAAQWQVVGFLKNGPATVAELARRRGLRRQSVQETVNRLLCNGMLSRVANPDDGRAPLLHLTDQARAAVRTLSARQVEWAEAVAGGLPPQDVATTLRTLRAMRAMLD